MDRRALKAAARQSLRDAVYSPQKVTLACILGLLALMAAAFGTGVLLSQMNRGSSLSGSVAAVGRIVLISFVVSTVIQLACVLLLMGYGACSLRIARGEEFDLRTLLTGFSIWSRGILLYLYTTVLLSLWGTLFAMPFSYVMSAFYLAELMSYDTVFTLVEGYLILVMLLWSYRYRMAWFILLDDPQLPLSQILNRAKAINRIHRVKLFLMDLSFLPWLLLSLLTAGILLIWKLPYITTTYAHAYDFMQKDYRLRQERLQEFLARQRQQFGM